MSDLKVPSFAKDILETVLSSPVTLSKLAASGMFASVLLGIPSDVHNADFKIHYEGVLTKRSVLEVYAPGDETGWAVVYKEAVDGFHTGEIELIWGKWELFQDDEPSSIVPVEVAFGTGLIDLEEIVAEVTEAVGLEAVDVDSQIEENMYKEYFRGEGYPY